MASRELKKKQSESVSELHTIDVARALSGAKDAAKKLSPPPTRERRRTQAQTHTFRTRTLPIIIASGVIIAIATYFIVSRLAS